MVEARAASASRRSTPRIARHADTELLYDQPYEDNKRVRVTGPFTVESLSPHRVLAADEERPGRSEAEAGSRRQPPASSSTMILDNLKKAGVQNTVKSERLELRPARPVRRELDPGRGRVHRRRRQDVAASPSRIGPEHGTVGPEQVKEAAKEAVQGVGFDLLVVCGFAFDPHVVARKPSATASCTVLPRR